jgi:hypothetical protein
MQSQQFPAVERARPLVLFTENIANPMQYQETINRTENSLHPL